MSAEAEQSMLQAAAISDLTIRDNTKNNSKPARSNYNRLSKAAFTSEAKPTRDITSDFTKAANSLPTGDLVKDEWFTLFEAVGALEIMDPKMDSGFLAPGDTLEDDYDVLGALTPNEVIGIMDSMLCSEVAWQTGHPLSQTLFTSLYIDRILWPEPRTLDEASFSRTVLSHDEDPLLHLVLRAYCLLLIKASHYVLRTISNECFYEEEDFVTNLYHRTLLAEVAMEDILKLATHAQDFVSAQENLSSSIREAILCRLKCRVSFLRAVAVESSQFQRHGPQEWASCLNHLKNVLDTHSLGTEVIGSFSVKVQRRLASSVPPRPIVNVDFETAIQFQTQLCKDSIWSEKGFQCAKGSNVLTFLRVFGSSKPQSSLYVRCLIQSHILDGTRRGGKEAERDVIFDDLEELVLPHHILLDKTNSEIELPSDHRFQIWEKMNKCTPQLFDAYHDLVRALCMNRPRTRRMLCHLIVDWDNVQLDMEELDSSLRAYTWEKPIFKGVEAWELPLSSWAYFHKLRQMEWIVQLGFELNIYHVDEWPGMFQYLQDVADARQKHVNRIYGFVHHHNSEAFRTNQKQDLAAFSHTISVLEFAAEEANAISNLAQTFAYLYQALSLLSLIPKYGSRSYSSPEYRRAIRMKPFLGICLPQLTSISEPFDKIESMVESLPYRKYLSPLAAAKVPKFENVAKAVALLDSADQSLKIARKSLDMVGKADPEAAMCIGCEDEWRKGVKDVFRAAVVAGVVGMRVRKWAIAGAKEGEMKLKYVEDDIKEGLGGLAACWVVPTIVS